MSTLIAPISNVDDERSIARPRVAMLTNRLLAHSAAVCEALAERLDELVILVSHGTDPLLAPKECQPRVAESQLCWKMRQERIHPLRLNDQLTIYVPWDTLWKLWRTQPDVMVSYELGFRSLFCALYRRFCPRTRLILCTNLSEHTELGRGWLRNGLRRWLLRVADQITYNGVSGRRYLKNFGVSDDKLTHVPYAASRTALYNGPLERPQRNETRLLYVGKLNDLKDVLPFTRSLAEWAQANPNRSLNFTLVGEGAQRRALEQLELPGNLHLRLLGARPQTELPAIYADHDLFVFPSLCDEWGLVVNEALHAGLPVLGSVFSQAVLELVQNDVNGWTYQPTAAGSLTSALDRALNLSSEELNRLRAYARESVAERTPEHTAMALLGAIDRTRYAVKGTCAR